MSNKKSVLILFLALVLVLSVEIFYLQSTSLWHDESFSALLIRYDFSEMISRIKMDVHPPLFYILLRGWDFIFGDSLFSLRFFSVFFASLSIIGLYILVNKTLQNRKLALFSSLLFAFSYFQIQYAMEARMYSLGTFLVIIGTYFFLEALKTKKWKWWLLYAFSVSLGLYTHYFVAFWIISQAIYLSCQIAKESKNSASSWVKNQNFQMAAVSYFLVFVSYLPWLGTFLKQIGQVQQDYWIPAINIWSIPNTFLKMTWGNVVNPQNAWYVLVVLMVLIFSAVFFFIKKTKIKERWLFFLLLAVPFLLTAVLSFRRPIYIDRYFIFGFPFYLIILAEAILLITNVKIKRALIVLTILGSLITFPFHWSRLDAANKPGMAAAADYLNKQFEPGEKIFVGSSLIYFTFKYYNQTGYSPKLYAPGFLPHYSGTALLSAQDLIADFSKETKTDDIVWMLNTTGFGNFQPQVPENWLKEDEKSFQDVYDYRGWIIVSRYNVR